MLKKKVLGCLIIVPLPFPGFLPTISSSPFSPTLNLVCFALAPSLFALPFSVTSFFILKICSNVQTEQFGTVLGEWGHDVILKVYGYI